MSKTYQYARPALTVDVVVFALDEDDLQVMLIQRDLKPFEGQWALPGGFVRVDETLADAARRELQEETGLKDIFLEQLYTFGDLDRDPRERVVTVAYYALVNLAGHDVLRQHRRPQCRLVSGQRSAQVGLRSRNDPAGCARAAEEAKSATSRSASNCCPKGSRCGNCSTCTR